MKISNSKKQLAKIISENGGWRDGAESAAQSKSDNAISFYCDTAYRDGDRWWGSYIIGGDIAQILLLPNWHQTILSRDEYFYLYPVVEAAPETVVEAKPTIEQLVSDYRNAKNYADRKQQEADDAKADAEAKLAELVAAGKAIGLVLSIETTESKCANGVMQITKRSQLELGDVIWIGKSGVKEDERRLPEGEYKVVKVGTIGVLHNGVTFYPDFSFRSWRFIRRP